MHLFKVFDMLQGKKSNAVDYPDEVKSEEAYYSTDWWLRDSLFKFLDEKKLKRTIMSDLEFPHMPE